MGCFASAGLATAIVGFQAQAILIWVANGLLLSYLLLAPRRRWIAYLLAGFAGQIVGSQLVYPHFGTNLLLGSLNIVEVLLAAWLLRRRASDLPRFTERAYLLRFCLFATLAAPMAAAFLYAIISLVWLHTDPVRAFREWAISDGVGVAIATPAFVAIFMTRFRKPVNWKGNWVYPVLFAAVTLASFAQVRLPILFLIYPLLLLVLLRLGLAWAALCALFTAAVSTRYTMVGLGPFSVMAAVTKEEPGIMLQAFLAVGMLLVYAVSMILQEQRAAERRLQDVASLHKLVTENSRDAILVSDFAGLRRYFSPAVEELLGWPVHELVKRRFRENVHPEDRPQVVRILNALQAGQEHAQSEFRVKRKRGDYIWVESSMTVFRDPRTGIPLGILDFIRDISERRRSEQSREFHLSLIGAIHEVSLDGILVVDSSGNAVSYNQRFIQVWQITAPEIPARIHDEEINISDEQLLSQCLNKTVDPEGFLKRIQELYADPEQSDECDVALLDGRTLERYSTGLRTRTGQPLGRVWFFRDITDRKRAEQQLRDAYTTVEALAVQDSLTGLANRRRFDECLEPEWRRAMRDGVPLSMLIMDVDLFKLYNDTYGHLAGDQCLKEIAQCALEVAKRPGDLVTRFGGEEFAIILPATDTQGAVQLAEAICANLRSRKLPHQASPHNIATVSIGCATVIPLPGEAAVSILEQADLALYRAKHSGRNCVCSESSLANEAAPSQPPNPPAALQG